ncbi:MAG TPA: xanthine dehydrogenase family protein subunit M, partial [Acidimicrobiia bacterium]|nr:xanthine dehydrogenase family protein subunit M [Acidimicrobiia bacterium]
PAPFEYHAPETVADVVGLLSAHGDDAKPLAGGQSLVPMLALRLARFEHLVDLNRVTDLTVVERRDGAVLVGAMTRQTVLERPGPASDVSLLAQAAPLIGHFQIRNRGTVGGSVAHADPASELPAVALALDAELQVAGPSGPRVVPAAEFFVGNWTTVLEPDELLTGISFPVWEGRCGSAVEEVARRHGDFALTGTACAVCLDAADRIERCAIALFGMGSTPVRAPEAEAALIGRAGDASELSEAAQLAVQGLDPPDDVHASARYRRSVGAHVVRRGLTRALEGARR